MKEDKKNFFVVPCCPPFILSNVPKSKTGKVAVKDLIEEMREEVRVESGVKINKSLRKPRSKAKRPSTPNPKRPKKPLKRGKSLRRR